MLRLVPIAAALMLLLALSSCSPARMATPRSLDGRSQTLHVKLDRGPVNEAVVFGPWHTKEIDRKWTTRIGGGVKFAGVGIVDEQADQPYTFTLARNGSEHTWFVECVTSLSNEEVIVGPVRLRKGTTSIRCLAADERKGHKIEIAVMMKGNGHVGGVHVGKEWYKVETAHKIKGGATLGTAAGYTIRRGYSMVAAVQTINDRLVWLRTGMDEEIKPPVAITLTSLLLYRPLSSRSGRI